jgi:hypothetical protein
LIPNKKVVDTHEANAFANGGRKCVENMYSWGEPFCQALSATPASTEILVSSAKHSENVIRGSARPELGK